MEAWAITSSTGSRNVSVLASSNHTRRSRKTEATWPQRSTKAPRCCCTRQVRLQHAHTRLPYRAQIRTRHKHAHTHAHKRRSIDERFRPANHRGRSRIGREASCSRLRLGGRYTMYIGAQAWRRRARTQWCTEHAGALAAWVVLESTSWYRPPERWKRAG